MWRAPRVQRNISISSISSISLLAFRAKRLSRWKRTSLSKSSRTLKLDSSLSDPRYVDPRLVNLSYQWGVPSKSSLIPNYKGTPRSFDQPGVLLRSGVDAALRARPVTSLGLVFLKVSVLQFFGHNTFQDTTVTSIREVWSWTRNNDTTKMCASNKKWTHKLAVYGLRSKGTWSTAFKYESRRQGLR